MRGHESRRHCHRPQSARGRKRHHRGAIGGEPVNTRWTRQPAPWWSIASSTRRCAIPELRLRAAHAVGRCDPIDVLVANTRPIIPGAVMNVRPIGVLRMEDDGGATRRSSLCRLHGHPRTSCEDAYRSAGDQRHQIEHSSSTTRTWNRKWSSSGLGRCRGGHRLIRKRSSGRVASSGLERNEMRWNRMRSTHPIRARGRSCSTGHDGSG